MYIYLSLYLDKMICLALLFVFWTFALHISFSLSLPLSPNSLTILAPPTISLISFSLSLCFFISLHLYRYPAMAPPLPFYFILAAVYHREPATMGYCTCALKKNLCFKKGDQLICLEFFFFSGYSHCIALSLYLSLFFLSRYLSPVIPPHPNFFIPAVVYHRNPPAEVWSRYEARPCDRIP